MEKICNSTLKLFCTTSIMAIALFCYESASAQVKTLFVNKFSDIIHNTSSEDCLLNFAVQNGFNDLLLYDLYPIMVVNGHSTWIASFIQKAKTTYGLKVTASGESKSFITYIKNYNNAAPANQKFDAFCLEFEFWIQGSIGSVGGGGDYCDYYLDPNGYTCDFAGAWAYLTDANNRIQDMKSEANAGLMAFEIYLGQSNISMSQFVTIAQTVDTLLLTSYTSQANVSTVYTAAQFNDRVKAIADAMDLGVISTNGRHITIRPIFSSEGSSCSEHFLGTGNYLLTHLYSDPYTVYYLPDFNNESYTNIVTYRDNGKLVVDGYNWFKYSEMPAQIFYNGNILSSGITVCSGATFTSSPGCSYVWQNATTNNTITLTNTSGSSIVIPLQVTVTNALASSAACANQTWSSQVFNITVKPLPLVNAGADVSICYGNSTTLTATGASSYVWNPGGGTTASITVIPLASTIYTVIGTGLNGCSNTDQVSVTVNLNPAATITTTAVSCYGGNDGTACANVVGGTPGYMYAWSCSGLTTDCITLGQTSGCTVTVTDANNCQGTSAPFDITQPALLTASATAPPIICHGWTTTVTVTATGGTGGITGTGIFNNVSAGSYTYTVTDANGCTASATINITDPALPSLTITNSSAQSCIGSELCASPTYPTYQWSSGESTQCIQPSTSGSYTVTITDASTCTNSATYTFTLDPTCCHNVNLDYSGGPTVSGNKYNINADVIISGAVDFINNEFYIAPGVTITVANNASLNITSGSILHACGDMWKGIVLTGPNSPLTVDGSSFISDAEVAITSNDGSVFSLDDAHLDRNYKHIVVNSNAGGIHGATIVNSTFSCSNCPGVPLAHNTYNASITETCMEIKDVGLIKVGDPTSTMNSFGDATHAGIESNNSNIVVNFNHFQNIIDPTSHKAKAVSVSNSNFSHVGTGGTNEYNSFDHCDYGVVFAASTGVIVSNYLDNMITGIGLIFCTNNQVSVWLNTIENSYVGIYSGLNAGGHIDISNNRISILPSSIYMTGGIGIDDPFAPSFTSVARNVISTMGTYGIHTSGSKGIGVSNNHIYMNYPNHLSSRVFGIEADNCSKNNFFCNIIENPTAANKPFQRGITMNVSANNTLECNSTYGTEYGLQFIGNCNPSILKANSMSKHDVGMMIGEPLLAVPGSQIGNQTYVYNGGGSQFLPGNLFNGNLVATFCDLTLAPSLFYVFNLVAGFPDYPTPNNNNAGSSIVPTWDPAHPTYPLYQCNPCSAPHLRTSDSNSSQNDMLGNENVQLRRIDISSIQPIQSAKQNSPEENQKIVNTIYSQTIAQNIFTFTKAQEDMIEYVAFQCPYIGGTAVYDAQAILRTQNPLRSFDNDMLCGTKTEKTNPSGSSNLNNQSYLSIHPNPSSGAVTINYDLSQFNNISLTIYDILGNIIVQQKLGNNSNLKLLDLSKVNQGVYFYKVLVDDKLFDTNKITILK